MNLDPGILSDIHHLSRRGGFEARKRGDDPHLYNVFAGGSLMVIGARMIAKEWDKMHPPGRMR